MSLDLPSDVIFRTILEEFFELLAREQTLLCADVLHDGHGINGSPLKRGGEGKPKSERNGDSRRARVSCAGAFVWRFWVRIRRHEVRCSSDRWVFRAEIRVCALRAVSDDGNLWPQGAHLLREFLWFRYRILKDDACLFDITKEDFCTSVQAGETFGADFNLKCTRLERELHSGVLFEVRRDLIMVGKGILSDRAEIDPLGFSDVLRERVRIILMLDENGALRVMPENVMEVRDLVLVRADEARVDTLFRERRQNVLPALVGADIGDERGAQAEARGRNGGVGGIPDPGENLIEFVGNLCAVDQTEFFAGSAICLLDAQNAGFFNADKIIGDRVADGDEIELFVHGCVRLWFNTVDDCITTDGYLVRKVCMVYFRYMDTTVLESVARELVAPGKGILAADESNTSCAKRFDAVGVECTEETRREYREILVTTPANNTLSGIIFYDETFWQATSDGIPFREFSRRSGVHPGIKVDLGLVDLPGFPKEKISKGLDDLPERIAKYKEAGAVFAKWRSVIEIGAGIPTDECIGANTFVLARYARICQDNNVVPIVEPEVLFDGTHTAARAEEVLAHVYDILFQTMRAFRVHLPGAILKTSMALPGKSSGMPIVHSDVAERTVRALHGHVPKELGGVVFLSGGQTSFDAMKNLEEIVKRGPHPWGVTFSYSRALQDPVLKYWAGNRGDTEGAKRLFSEQLRIASSAAKGSLVSDRSGDTFVSHGQDL